MTQILMPAVCDLSCTQNSAPLIVGVVVLALAVAAVDWLLERPDRG